MALSGRKYQTGSNGTFKVFVILGGCRNLINPKYIPMEKYNRIWRLIFVVAGLAIFFHQMLYADFMPLVIPKWSERHS